MRIETALEEALKLFFPNECAVCGREISPFKLICEGCEKSLLSSGPMVRKIEKKGYTLHVYGEYSGELRSIILGYKSGRWRISSILSDLYLRIFEYFPPKGVLTFIPSTLESIEERGFDHMEIITKRVAKRTGIPFERCLEVASEWRQIGRSGRERRKARGRFISRCGEDRVALLDDVYTTGSTVENAIEALKSSGVKVIDVYVLALSNERRDGRWV